MEYINIIKFIIAIPVYIYITYIDLKFLLFLMDDGNWK